MPFPCAPELHSSVSVQYIRLCRRIGSASHWLVSHWLSKQTSHARRACRADPIGQGRVFLSHLFQGTYVLQRTCLFEIPPQKNVSITETHIIRVEESWTDAKLNRRNIFRMHFSLPHFPSYLDLSRHYPSRCETLMPFALLLTCRLSFLTYLTRPSICAVPSRSNFGCTECRKSVLDLLRPSFNTYASTSVHHSFSRAALAQHQPHPVILRGHSNPGIRRAETS